MAAQLEELERAECERMAVMANLVRGAVWGKSDEFGLMIDRLLSR